MLAGGTLPRMISKSLGSSVGVSRWSAKTKRAAGMIARNSSRWDSVVGMTTRIFMDMRPPYYVLTVS